MHVIRIIYKLLNTWLLLERHGSRIPTMIDEMQQHSLNNPAFDDIHEDFVVSLY